MIDGVWDFKSYLEPYLNTIEGHSKYGVFRFTRASSGHAEMHYKKRSTDPWEPNKTVDELMVIEAGLKVVTVRRCAIINRLHSNNLFSLYF